MVYRRHQTTSTNALENYAGDCGLSKGVLLSGDESKLKPMILKDIANEIEMIFLLPEGGESSKSVQTEFGLYLLKYFFSEGISTESGEDACREVKIS